jgi:4-hydroxybenzoate polyprenyltransferase
MTARLYHFAVKANPPAIYLPLTLLWAAGLTGLLVVSAAPAHQWPHDAGVLVTAVTLFLAMLLLRALDDLRDLDYDRVHAPERALPSGAVSVRDLVILASVGAGALLALNAGRGAALLVLAVLLGYTAGLITVNVRLHWPASENLLLHLALNLPIQVLLSLYVYVAFLQANHLPLATAGLCATAAVVLAFVHLEFARKATRAPARAERTYVRHLGLGGTLAVASAAAVLAVGLASAAVRPWSVSSPAHGWGWLALVPLAVPVVAGWRFWRHRLPRWPAHGALGFPLCAFLAFLAIGLLGQAP